MNISHSNHEVIQRKEVKRVQNQKAIQRTIDRAAGDKEDEWNKILGLTFNVRFAETPSGVWNKFCWSTCLCRNWLLTFEVVKLPPWMHSTLSSTGWDI